MCSLYIILYVFSLQKFSSRSKTLSFLLPKPYTFDAVCHIFSSRFLRENRHTTSSRSY